MRIPSEITSGDSAVWDDSATVDNLGNAVTSADWTLKYYIVGAGSLTLTAVAEGTGWRTTLTVAQSDTLEAGTYYWQAVATKGSPEVTDKLTLGSGQLKVNANLADAEDGFDGRSQAEQDLAAVQAAIRSIVAGGGNQEYTIGNRSARKYSLADLLALESKLKAEVVREKQAEMIANGLGNPKNMFVRFT